MKVKGIRWIGTRTDKLDAMVNFYTNILLLPQSYSEPGFAAFDIPNGDRVEVFALDYPDHAHFTTGPVGGFEVEDIKSARREMEEKGIEFWDQLRGINHAGLTSEDLMGTFTKSRNLSRNSIFIASSAERIQTSGERFSL